MTMTMVLKWEAPEPVRRGRRANPRWAAVAVELKNRPGEWGLVAENARSSGLQWLRDRGFEIAARGTSANGLSAKLYARWPADGGE